VDGYFKLEYANSSLLKVGLRFSVLLTHFLGFHYSIISQVLTATLTSLLIEIVTALINSYILYLITSIFIFHINGVLGFWGFGV